jgi:hypothetical protein
MTSMEGQSAMLCLLLPCNLLEAYKAFYRRLFSNVVMLSGVQNTCLQTLKAMQLYVLATFLQK